MKKLAFFLIWIILLVFSLSSFFISYSLYIQDREEKISKNIVSFLALFPEKKVIPLPYPELTLIKIKKESEVYLSSNLLKPVDYAKYFQKSLKLGNKTIEIYIKKQSLDDFILFLFGKPILLALNLFIFVVYISFYYFTLNEFKESVEIKPEVEEPEKEKINTEELINYLKGLKVLLHTEKILKEDALNKAKNMVDDLIKKLQNK